jgi:hypothetical protein
MLQTITATSPAVSSAIRRTIGPLPGAASSARISRSRPKPRGTPVVAETGAAACVVGDRTGPRGGAPSGFGTSSRRGASG